jgi:hypothetical protein
VTDRHLSAADLDLVVIGDGTGTDHLLLAELQRHARECPTCEQRWERRVLSRSAFEQVELPRLLSRLRERPAGIGFGRLVLLGAMASALGAAVLVAARHPGLPEAPTPAAPPAAGPHGIKGVPGLRLIARRGEAVFEVTPGGTLQTGDALRFVLEPVGRPYLLIASLDGQGKASIYHPFGGSSSARVAPDQLVEAPAGSVVLDSARGPERVFALWSSQPLDAADVLAALRELGRRGPTAIRATTAVDVPGTIQASRMFEKGDAP